MTQNAGTATLDMPAFSLAAVRRFNRVATIRDEAGFLAELNKLVRELAASPERSIDVASATHDLLRAKARALKADVPWQVSASDIQRGRAAMLQEFDQPKNLPLAAFAVLAHKSRQQIYKDIAARRLLALNVGRRGQRIPDWQLDPPALKLTQSVLTEASDVDAWTLYHVLSRQQDALKGRSPIAAVRHGRVDEALTVVRRALGLQARASALELR